MAKTKIELPLKEALLEAMKVAETSVEAAQYLATRFKEILTGAKMLEKYADVLKSVETFAQLTEFKLLSRGQPWFGQVVDTTDFKNMHANIGRDVAESLKNMGQGIAENVTFHFAVNDQAEFLRGCTSGGKPLDSKAVEHWDKLFIAYLAENNVITKGTTLYQSDEHGQIKLDEQGNQLNANPAQLKALISDPQKGFEKYVVSKGIPITCQQQEYPSVQKDVQAQMAVQEAIATAPEKEQGLTAEEPQPSMRTTGV